MDAEQAHAPFGDRRAGPRAVAVSLANGSGAQADPIVSYEHAVVSTRPTGAALAQDLRAFLNWAITSGTAQPAKVNFRPPPPSVGALSDVQMAKIKG